MRTDGRLGSCAFDGGGQGTDGSVLEKHAAPDLDYRTERKLARSSSENASGCSQAAKCPPFAKRL
jgi:hypothetical protein